MSGRKARDSDLSWKNRVSRGLGSLVRSLRPGSDRRTDADRARGILVFEHTSLVIRAESALKGADMDVQVKGPPPQIRTGCDLVIEFPLVEELRVLRILEGIGLEPLEIAAVGQGLLQPVDIYHVKNLGNYVMVRAANMKITVDRASRQIVNVSGGGCPDVPYLARIMVGRSLDDCPSPREFGHTLCGYALHLAFEEAQRIC
ncbi:MAG: DUF3343 domain-containing protein [Deltaproteobacteria bacterium]|nr:DUF3343 domain-containing protein [Deltaproteobacteria bacterium]